MKIKSLHEIYISFKLFETIGFHNQGVYRLSAQALLHPDQPALHAHPIPLSHKKNHLIDNSQASNRHRNGMVNKETGQYHSSIFDVSFNEQTFPFSGGCKFKLQLDPKQEEPSQIILLLKLEKYAEDSVVNSKSPTDSSECILKENMDMESRRNISRLYTKEPELVSKTQILINLSQIDLQSPDSSYRKAIFTTYQYFSSISLTLSYCRLGYKLRLNCLPLSQIQEATSRDNLPRDSKNQMKEENEKESVTVEDLVQLLVISFGSIKKMYKKFIKEGLKEYQRIYECENHLQNNFRKPSSSALMSTKFASIAQSNCDPDSEWYPSAQLCHPPQLKKIASLMEYYDCQSETELTLLLFEENNKLTTLIEGRWSNCLNLYCQQDLNSAWMERFYSGSGGEIDYLRKNRYTKNITESSIYKEFTPKMRYIQEQQLKIPLMHKIISESMEEEIFIEEEADHESTLFILVHGFNGNQFDMNRIKSFIGCYQSYQYLILRNIAGKILDSLEDLGTLASEEILGYLNIRTNVRKINFIGFSLGGLIIRAALSHLSDYSHLFNLFITLSSPHLGVNELSSCLVKTGVTFLHKIRGVKNLKQLTIDIDHDEKRKPNKYEDSELTYFERLAKDEAISCFKTVVFCGSEEDKYVPGYSSTLRYSGENPRIRMMQEQLMSNIRNLHRISVVFDPTTRGGFWDRLSGRRIHINFLDNESFLGFLLADYSQIF